MARRGDMDMTADKPPKKLVLKKEALRVLKASLSGRGSDDSCEQAPT
ncbi:MAG TPA: hypothetical protein VFZ09_20135 [Archangium sp.]|nr:hypothetical protein [Archangium sp.]HEX5748560.1 hypothetical protein [Archangium sp.]